LIRLTLQILVRTGALRCRANVQMRAARPAARARVCPMIADATDGIGHCHPALCESDSSLRLSLAQCLARDGIH